MQAQRILAAFAALALAAAAHAQKTYECKDPVTGSLYQRYDPCPSGSDPRPTPEQQRNQQKAAAEDARHRQSVQDDYASLRGEVRMGMTREQVQRAWGTPLGAGTQVSESSTREWWSFACGYSRRGAPIGRAYVYFRNDRVTGISRYC